MDCIFIRELRLDAWIGLHRYEKVAPQTIELELELGFPNPGVFQSGRVADTIDYGVAVQRLKELLAAEKFGLIESLADRVARVLLDEFHAPWVKVTATKLGVLKEAKRVGVKIERSQSK